MERKQMCELIGNIIITNPNLTLAFVAAIADELSITDLKAVSRKLLDISKIENNLVNSKN